jgi:uncharacterized protein (UPF0262 family)
MRETLLTDVLTTYLDRKDRYPQNVTESERELIDAIDWAVRGLKNHGNGPYGALEHMVTAVMDLIEDREPDDAD